VGAGEPLRRPGRAVALIFVGIAAVAAVMGLATGRPWPETVAVVAVFLVAAAVMAGAVWLELSRRRREADRWLAWGVEVRPESDLLTWRANELVSPRNRRLLARNLRSVAHEAEGRTMLGPVPLNRRAIWPELKPIYALADRLADLTRAVTPRGALLVERLLTEPGSALYSPNGGDVLRDVLAEARAALEPAVAGEARRSPTESAGPQFQLSTHLNLFGGR
jgi:hypothetical protein